ncbi:unnamed protein product [Cunninghamella blakesleeana]
MSSIEKVELEEKSIKDDQPFVKSDEEKRFVRKLYLSVLPMVWCIIFIQFVDKAILSVASGSGLLEETKMTPEQYNWVASIVYLGYLVYQIPNNILIQILPHAKYLGVLMVLWGIVVTLTSLCNNFQQMMVVRFLLGLFESGCLPIVYIVLNTLFRRSEHSIVYGFTIISTGTGTVIGTVIGVGIIKTFGDTAWRKGYLIFGIVTIILGVIVFFLFIDTPTSRLLRLSEKEKEIVKERTADNMVVKTKEIKKYQIWEALKELRFWCLFFSILLINLQASGLIAYSVLLLQSLGFNTIESVILQIPSGGLAALYTLIAIIFVKKTNQSILTGIGFTFLSIIGCIVLITSQSTAGKLVGYYLSWAQAAPQATFITIVGNNVLGYTKKVTYNGANIIAYVLGSFIGPFFLSNYQFGIVGYIIANSVVILLLLVLRFDMARSNRRRKQNTANGVESKDDKFDVHLDLTDRENEKFIYIL